MYLSMGQKKAFLIGNGTMGKRHRTRFEECGVRFEKVFDAEIAGWSRENKDENLDVLQNPPDFVVIASPASTHYEYVKYFLERSVPVLVEKPLATTASQAKELVELSLSKKTLLFVAQSECYNPLFLNFRKHFLKDLENAVAALQVETSQIAAPQTEIPQAVASQILSSQAVAGHCVQAVAENDSHRTSFEISSQKSLNVKLEFRREHGFSERCRDVDVSLDLLIHDVSLFLNLFDAKDVKVMADACPSVDCREISLKVVSGRFAGVEAVLVADRNSQRDLRTVSVTFGRNGCVPGFEYSVSLARYTGNGEVLHLPDSLDNEHKFFLKLLAGSFRKWTRKALLNAAQSVSILTQGGLDFC